MDHYTKILNPDGTISVVDNLEVATSQLSEIASVSNFGAIGDGTDETIKIQAAINSNAKVIIFDPRKTYKVTKLIIPSDKMLDGRGAKLKLIANSYTPVITNLDYAHGANKNIVIRNLEVEGSKNDHNPTGLNYLMNCIYFEGVDGVIVENVKAYDAYGICIYLRDCKDDKVLNSEAYGSERHSGIISKKTDYYTETIIQSCHCHHNNLDGIEFFRNTSIAGNICHNNGLCNYEGDLPSAGIYGGSNEQDNCKIINNICYENSGTGIETNIAKNIEVNGNTCYRNGLSGITMQKTTYSTAIGNTCFNNHQTTDPTYINDGDNSGIVIGTWTPGTIETHNTVIGNVCYDDQVTKTQVYGLQVINCDYNTVIGNKTYGNRDANILKNYNSNSIFMDKLSDLLNSSTIITVKDITVSGGTLNLNSATAMYIPKAGTPNAGCIRFNDTSKVFEGHNGTAWVPLS